MATGLFEYLELADIEAIIPELQGRLSSLIEEFFADEEVELVELTGTETNPMRRLKLGWDDWKGAIGELRPDGALFITDVDRDDLDEEGPAPEIIITYESLELMDLIWICNRLKKERNAQHNPTPQSAQ